MKLSSATGLNLSLLSADFYALLVGIQLFEYKVSGRSGRGMGLLCGETNFRVFLTS